MDFQSSSNAKKLTDSAEDVIEIMSLMHQCLEYFPLGSVDWFLMTAFLNQLNGQLEDMREKVSAYRPSKSVRKVLTESYMNVATAATTENPKN